MVDNVHLAHNGLVILGLRDANIQKLCYIWSMIRRWSAFILSLLLASPAAFSQLPQPEIPDLKIKVVIQCVFQTDGFHIEARFLFNEGSYVAHIGGFYLMLQK